MAASLRNMLAHAGTSDTPGKKPRTFTLPKRDEERRTNFLRSALAQSRADRPPTPPQKDAAREMDQETPTTPVDSDQQLFRPGHLSRAGSVYSLSRVSFTSQISQLTAIRLPDAASLSTSISLIPTAEAAAVALRDAADQIHAWIQKASDVLGGLEAEDDADWAAAAGKDGVGEVDQAIARFEGLVDVYIGAVEALQLRHDVAFVDPEDMALIVSQVEAISVSWQKVRRTLKSIKHQVELALECEELVNGELGNATGELEILSRMIFEMEERRHQAFTDTSAPPVDINALETMVDSQPAADDSDEEQATVPEDSTLLGIFARMQPLRAALDFLPMQISAFAHRGHELFPTACRDLEERREELEVKWARLDADAEALRKEVGEDRWNLVFRNAAKQAIRMIDSVERTLKKVDESLGHDTQLRHSSSTIKKIENYEAKKVHVCPAIDRVLTIIERGVKDRLTVNGEILRLRADIRQRWQSLQIEVRSMDSLLDEYAREGGYNQQQVRDSVSSILSSAQSDPIFSPASSPESAGTPAQRDVQDSLQEISLPMLPSPKKPVTPVVKKPQTLPPPRTTLSHRTSQIGLRSTTPSITTPPSASRSYAARAAALATPPDNRPRWSYSNRNRGDYDVGEYYRTLMAKGASVNKSHRLSSAPHSFPSPSTPASAPRVRPSSSSTPQTPPPTNPYGTYPRVRAPNTTPSYTPRSRPTSRLARKRSDLSTTSTSSPMARLRGTSTSSNTPASHHIASGMSTTNPHTPQYSLSSSLHQSPSYLHSSRPSTAMSNSTPPSMSKTKSRPVSIDSTTSNASRSFLPVPVSSRRFAASSSSSMGSSGQG